LKLNEIKLTHSEFTLSREELLKKLGIKGQIIVDIDIMRMDDMILIKTKPKPAVTK